MRTNIFLITLFILAVICIIIGLVFPFFNCGLLSNKYDNSEYISALFSLASVILFFAALMYQLREYKKQNAELTKSIQAQIKSSEALDEQKRILLEQNTNSLIFGMIDSFNLFRERNKTQIIIDKLAIYYQEIFALLWQNKLKELQSNHKELNIQFAKNVKELFSKTIVTHEDYWGFKRYIYFVYNIFELIDQNKSNMDRDNFTPFFHCQLNTNETFLIYLANLVNNGQMPYCNKIQWTNLTTEEFIDFIKKSTFVNTDYSEIDYGILTDQFINLKQK